MPRDGVATFLKYGMEFCADHPELNATQQTFGGLFLGALRAIMECDFCPGHFRVPVSVEKVRTVAQDAPDGDYIACPHCGRVWGPGR